MYPRVIYGAFNGWDRSRYYQARSVDYTPLYVWFSIDAWLHPVEIHGDDADPVLPAPLVSLIERWKAEVAAELPSFRPEWYEKYAALSFIYRDELYTIYPSAVGSTQEHFCRLSEKMERNLRAIGSPYTIYTGMLD